MRIATAFVFWLCSFPASGDPVQEDRYVELTGNCYDIATGVPLITQATAFLATRKVDLGRSNQSGVFHLRLPDSTRFLTFVSPGYRPITMPVNLGDEAGKRAKFSISFPMASLHSQEIEQDTRMALSFMVLDSMEIEYQLTYAASSSQRIVFGYKRDNHQSHITFGVQKNVGLKEGPYVLRGTSADGDLIVDEEMTIRKGLNFKSVVVKKPESAPEPDKKILVPPFNSVTLYFAQSSYDLQVPTKNSLDSIAQFLRVNQSGSVYITGYTDNVGRRNLNIVLSEYRARRVAAYLQRQGVLSSQIKLQWEGSDSPDAPNDTEENRAQNRRVVVEIRERSPLHNR